MIDPVDFLAQMSSQSAADNPVPKVVLGYIDYDFDTLTYPQIKPRVLIDGQGLSTMGYQCISTYDPVAGDRVVMVPVGTSYVIVGAINNPGIVTEVQKAQRNFLYPGTLVFSANNNGVGQALPAASPSTVFVNWGSSLIYDPYEFWVSTTPNTITPTIPGVYNIVGSVTSPANSASGSPTSGRREASVWINGGISRSGWNRTDATVGTTYCRVALSSKYWNANGETDYLQIRHSHEGNPGTGVVFGGTSDQASVVQLIYMGDSLDNTESPLPRPTLIGEEDMGI